MAEVRYQSRPTTIDTRAVDQGLRSYMLGVYNYMALGVALTAAVVLGISSSPGLLAAASGLSFIAFFAVLGLGWFAPRLMFSGNATTAHAAYWGYAALWGVMIAPMMARYLAIHPDLVFRAFLITAVTFGATSLAGYVTKRNLAGFSGFFTMASIGLIIAMLVNAFFFASTMGSFVLSGLVVLLFAGVTAWETQQIKEMYVEGDMPGAARSKSIFGAYMLYGSFVTLFTHILNMLGIMSSSDN